MANAKVAGIGILIEKAFQEGCGKLVKNGYDVHSLVRIAKLSSKKIEFLD